MTDEISVVNTRLEFLARLPKHAVCAEIGVFLGQFLTEILRQTEPELLHLIDPWLPTDYGAYQGLHPQVWNGIYRGMVEVCETNPRVKIHRGTSREVLKRFPDNILDWIYIDGDHRYPEVKHDLDAACRVVRRGGMICGHDLQLPGVRRAVCELLNSGKCKMRLVDMQLFTSWGGVKQ